MRRLRGASPARVMIGNDRKKPLAACCMGRAGSYLPLERHPPRSSSAAKGPPRAEDGSASRAAASQFPHSATCRRTGTIRRAREQEEEGDRSEERRVGKEWRW